MPSIASRLVARPPEVIVPSSSTTSSYNPVGASSAPGLSPTLRCPLPILTTPSPDNLRQYYSGGSIPQYRINTPPSISTLF
jgi:hypothetical protein